MKVTAVLVTTSTEDCGWFSTCIGPPNTALRGARPAPLSGRYLLRVLLRMCCVFWALSHHIPPPALKRDWLRNACQEGHTQTGARQVDTGRTLVDVARENMHKARGQPHGAGLPSTDTPLPCFMIGASLRPSLCCGGAILAPSGGRVQGERLDPDYLIAAEAAPTLPYRHAHRKIARMARSYAR